MAAAGACLRFCGWSVLERGRDKLSADPLEAIAAIGRIAQQAKATQTSALDPRAAMLLPWVHSVIEHANSKWGIPPGYPTGCQLASCRGQSFSLCSLCGKPCCLAHVFVSPDASVVCWDCVAAARPHVKRFVPAQNAPAPDDLKWAYELLGATPADSDAVVKKKFRAAANAVHPDKVDEGKKEASAPLFRQVSKAYDAIKKKRGIV